MDEDDSLVSLPADTQAILNQFLKDKEEADKSQDLFSQENWFDFFKFYFKCFDLLIFIFFKESVTILVQRRNTESFREDGKKAH